MLPVHQPAKPGPTLMSVDQSLYGPALGAGLGPHDEQPVLKGGHRRNAEQTSSAPRRASALMRYPAPRPPPMGPLPPLPKPSSQPAGRPSLGHVVSKSVSSYASFGSSSSGSGSGSSGSSSSDACFSPVTPPKAVVWQTTVLPASNEMDWSPDEWTPNDPFELGSASASRLSGTQLPVTESRASTRMKVPSRTFRGPVADRMSSTRPARAHEDALGLDLDLLGLFPLPPTRPMLRTPTWQQVRHTSGGTVIPPRSSSLTSSALSQALRPPSMSFSRMEFARKPVDDDGQTIIVRSERSGSGSNEVDCRWSGTFEDVFVTDSRRHRRETQKEMSEADKIRAAYLAGRD